MAQRKTIRSLDSSVLLSTATSLVAVAAMGFLVHGLMWARVSAAGEACAPGSEAAAPPAAKTPATPVRISAKVLAA